MFSLSIIVIMCGIVMLVNSIVFAARQGDSMSSVNEAAKTFSRGIVAALLVFSIWALGVGISGLMCFCKWCREGGCCWAVIYGCVLFIAWIFFIIMGSIVTGISMSGPETIQAFCDG